MKQVFSITQKEDLISYLEKHTDYRRKKIKSMVHYGQILVNQREISLPYLLKEGDALSITNEKIVKAPFPILYEDDRLLVVCKEAGLLTVSNQKNEKTLYQEVYQYVHEKGEKVFIVHRLDKETSGVLVFAKKEEIKQALQENWNEIVLKRKYVAVVKGNYQESGHIETYLKEEKNTFVHSSHTGKLAITDYQLLQEQKPYALLDISLKTGRKNQIRVHMKEQGMPVVGDQKYGGEKADRLYLHAYLFSFYDPILKKQFTFEASIPKTFYHFFQISKNIR